MPESFVQPRRHFDQETRFSCSANTFLTGNAARFGSRHFSVLFVLMELFVTSILRPVPIPAYAVLGQIAPFLGCQWLKLD
jgi:hypothetical protein